MNRRQTYGGMGMFNGRNKNRNGNGMRHSMAPLQNNMNLGNRRSSIMAMKMSKDPRPLKDKQWIEKQIHCLIEYLCSHGYESSMLSPKELSPPSTKNFQYICSFLFQQIDPTFFINPTKKFEDECVSFFEKLGYPFKINKSSLRCIAPHSWPPLLGALSWIIELLTFAESFDDDDDAADDDNSDDSDVKMKNMHNDDDEIQDKSCKSDDRLFFNLVANNYGLWLKGVDDDEAITNKLMNVFDEKISYLHENIESFKKANEQLIKEKTRIKEECPDISELQDQRQNTIAALNEIKNVVREREEYINTVKAKYQEWDNKVNEKITKIQNSEAKIHELREILSKQTISPKDVEIMKRESGELNEKKEELQLRKEEIKRKQYDVSENINHEIKAIKQLIREYNGLAQKIEIIPISAKYSFQQDHTLKLKDNILENIIVNKATDLVNKDVDNFGNNLQQLTNHYHDKLRKSESMIKNEHDKISQIKADLEIKKQEVGILNDRLSNIKNLYNEEKSKMSLLTAKTAQSIEKIELSMNAQSNDIDSELKAKKKEFIEISNDYNKLFESCKKIEIQLTSKIGIAIQKLIKHRQNIREQLKVVNKTLDESLEKVSFYHIQEPTLHNINHHDFDNDVQMDGDQI